MSTIGKSDSKKPTHWVKHASGHFTVTLKDGVNETVYKNSNVHFLRTGPLSLIYCIFNDWPFDPGATYPAIWISTSAPLEIREYAIKPEPSADEFFGLFATYSNGSVGGDNAGTGALKIKALYDAQNFIHIEGEAEFDYELSDGRTINIFINEFTAQYHPPIIRS